jgi:hypothetical protein
MNPQNQDQQPPQSQQVSNPIAAMQPGERIIAEIKRHPVGLFGVFLMAGFLLIVLALGTFVLLPSVTSNGTTPAIAAVLFILIAVLILLFTYIADRVYWGNRWIITSDSITQISQTSLFHKQSAQLGLESLEDVTAEQNGIFTHIFNYGILKAETAGERSRFVFRYCPNPNRYAQQILSAREQLAMGQHYNNPPAKPAVTEPAPQTFNNQSS